MNTVWRGSKMPRASTRRESTSAAASSTPVTLIGGCFAIVSACAFAACF
jgi:hypothetical protein